MDIGRISKQSFFIISTILLCSSLTFGKTITVGIGLGYDYSTIQSAINAAQEGDTIIVAQGEYKEAINFNGKNIILTSTDPNNWSIIENTIINPDYSNSVVIFSGQENETCILHGLTISDGGGVDYGGGINGNGTKATIRKCKINNNRAYIQGGGLYDCDGLIDDCIISSNDAQASIRNATSYGGGLYGCDGTINNCVIKSNVAGRNMSLYYFGNGGGLYNCNAQIINCIIEYNGAIGDGGGLHSCNAIISNCSIKNNTAGNSDIIGTGGGLYNCNADINNCTIQNNTATNKGGGLYGCNGTISGCTIKDNESTKNSGGGLANCLGSVENCTILGNISTLWHAGGAIDCNSFKNCTIKGNSARGYGGGLYNCKKVDRCTISGNSSEIYPGGGLADCNSVTNCIISGNTAGGSGAGLYGCNEIINCTIVGNYSLKKAGALYLKDKNGILNNTIIWDNLALEGGQVLVESDEQSSAAYSLSINYCDIKEGQNSVIITGNAALNWGLNNLDTNPLFVSNGSWTNQNKWNEGDYHLLNSSPCIDAGDPNGNYTDQKDIDSNARLIGQYVDIGADEAQEYIPPVFVQLEMSGPEQVTEGNSSQYNAAGRYDDDSEVDLTSNVTWSVEPDNIGTIDTNGLFTVGNLNESREVTIKAFYAPDNQEITYTAEMRVFCINLPEQVVTYYIDTASGNNQNDGLSRQKAFKTIQKGIDAAGEGDTVLVYPGVYNELVIFQGKDITLQSAEGAAVIQNPNNIAVLFYSEETSNCKIQNFVIRNSKIGILNILGSSPTIKNLTIVHNDFGIECIDSNPDISNCILWNNSQMDLFNCMATYSCMEDVQTGYGINNGNIYSNPLFVNANEGDYHMKSERGRYWPLYDIWVLDNATSPCIDAGNPEDDYSNERVPNGERINMGAYGNTIYASMTYVSEQNKKAYSPSPANGAIEVALRPTLSWSSGVKAVQHDVYLGTNIEYVTNATRNNKISVLLSQGQNSTNFIPSTYLLSAKTYFWRIDEIDSTGIITKGDIWSFTTISPSKPSRTACFIGQVPVWLDGKPVEISKALVGQSIGLSAKGLLVNQVQEHEGTYDLLDITLESGECITVAEEHYFMTDLGNWTSSKQLVEGMKLLTAKGTIKIKTVSNQSQPFAGKVYNLDIKGSDKYMVGKDAVIVRDY
jgi:hypothetical protein